MRLHPCCVLVACLTVSLWPKHVVLCIDATVRQVVVTAGAMLETADLFLLKTWTTMQCAMTACPVSSWSRNRPMPLALLSVVDQLCMHAGKWGKCLWINSCHSCHIPRAMLLLQKMAASCTGALAALPFSPAPVRQRTGPSCHSAEQQDIQCCLETETIYQGGCTADFSPCRYGLPHMKTASSSIASSQLGRCNLPLCLLHAPCQVCRLPLVLLLTHVEVDIFRNARMQ